MYSGPRTIFWVERVSVGVLRDTILLYQMNFLEAVRGLKVEIEMTGQAVAIPHLGRVFRAIFLKRSAGGW